MSVTVDVSAEHIARRIASTIDPVFAMIDGWRDVLERELSGSLAGALTGAGAPSAETLDPVVAALVSPELERDGSLITGAGFVASPGYLADAPWHLAWWLSGSNTFGAGPDPKLRRLEAVSDPDSEQFRDYTTLEWWRVPARTGTRHLTGPYVDYLCTDDYTVTITTPVRARRRDRRTRRHRPLCSPARTGAAAGDPRVGASVHAGQRVGPHRRVDRRTARDGRFAANRRARRGARAAARRRVGDRCGRIVRRPDRRTVRRHVARTRARGLTRLRARERHGAFDQPADARLEVSCNDLWGDHD